MAMWFYERDGAAIGPVTEEDLRERLRAGAIDRRTQVWSEALEGWTVLGETSLSAPDLGGAATEARSRVSQDRVACPACGVQTPRTETFCVECGSRIQGRPEVARPQATTRPSVPSTPVFAVPSTPDTMYASFGARVGAYLIDLVIWMVLSFAVGILVGLAATVGLVDLSSLSDDFYTTLSFAVLVLYWTWFESSGWQATPGKRVLGLRVVDGDGARLTGGRALGRALAKLLSGMIIIGFLMPLFTRRKQGLHDFMATTRVLAREATDRRSTS